MSQQLRPDYYKVTLRKKIAVDRAGIVDVDVEVQPFDIIRALGLSFFEGSLLKYLWRKDKKSQDPADRVSDARKVLTYAQQVLDDAIAAEGGAR